MGIYASESRRAPEAVCKRRSSLGRELDLYPNDGNSSSRSPLAGPLHIARGHQKIGASPSGMLSPCPPRLGKSVLFAKAAPAGYRRQALRKGIEPAIRRSLWIPRAPGAIGACFVNKNREDTEQSPNDRGHAHARLLGT